MEARAHARYVRVTPMKARRVVDLIRGLPAGQAQAVLRYAPQAATEPVGKVLNSAIANATNNSQLDESSLFVAEAFVDEGPTMKRFRPRAQGRAYRIRKRTSHITIVVEEADKPSTRKKRRADNAKSGSSTTKKDAGRVSAGASKANTAKKAAEAKADATAKKTAAKAASEKPAAKKAAADKTSDKPATKTTTATKTAEPKTSSSTTDKATGAAESTEKG